MADNLHFLHNASTYIGFNTLTNELIRFTPLSYELAIRIQKGENFQVLANEFSIPEAEIVNFKKNLETTTIQESVQTNPSFHTPLKSIERITLHISNSCNLKCSYCYASGGNYKMPENLMSEETADAVVSFLINTFTNIDDIVFFGGEPLLNYKIIEKICTGLAANSKLKVQRFNLITNGTLLNDDILRILNQYIDNIVVSIDGPAEANDFNRKYRNGQGSFRQIDKFIRTIQEKTDIKIQFESTYTSKHAELGYSIPDIFKYLNKTYQITGSIVTEMKEEEFNNRTIDYDIQTIDQFFETLDPSYLSQNISDILFSIAKKFKRSMCPIGQNIVAITTTGDIRLCHVILSENKFDLGNIQTDNIFTNKEKYDQLYPFLKIIHKEKGICKSCWASNLCGGCSLKWFYDYERKEFSQKPSPKLCEGNKKLFEKIILSLAKIQNDPQKYERLVELLKQ